jgi:hypothetical protein
MNTGKGKRSEEEEEDRPPAVEIVKIISPFIGYGNFCSQKLSRKIVRMHC